ncbi:LysM peptidoglycan-binding domain-containing protein [Thermophilibacter sp.]
MTRTTAALTAFDGNAALEVAPRSTLVLIEGGRGGHEASAAASSRLSPRQALAFVAAGAVVVLALVVGSLLTEARASAGYASALSGAPERVVTVRPGDSLWSLAEASDPDGVPVSEVVSWAMERNGLVSAELTVGQRLVMPVGAVG